MNEVAELFDCTHENVRKTLKVVKQKAPQLFPIISRRNWRIYRLWVEYNQTVKQIAKIEDISLPAVKRALRRVQKKLNISTLRCGKRPNKVQYQEFMDVDIRMKF